MIPEGWERTTLGRVAKITSGGTPDRNKPEYWGGDIPWVTTGEIGNGPIVSTSELITEIGLKSSSAKLFPAGTLLMAMYGQGKTRGKIAQLKINATTNQACAAILTKTAADASFLFQNLTARYDEIRNLSNDGSQKNLSGGLLKALPILLPPPVERERIAAIMETWDRAIEKVEALIANARAQKQALMQQLLPQGTTRPKKRLPGFSGEWKRAALGEIGAISSAGVDKKIVEGETVVRLVNFLDAYKREFIYDADLEHVVTAPKAKVQGCNVNKGDVFFTPSSETRDDIALAAVAAEDMPGVVYSYHVVRFRPTKRLDLNFSAFLFQTDDFKRQAYRLGDGSGQRYVISQSNFRKMQVSLPDIEEQAAIGSLLAEHSKSIADYETQLSALRQEKAALMQQLLTGKRRVKLPESEVV